ncbi:MAG: hypothetical protein P8P74_01150 [Crocinitomicaceae bacterium]|nr:hypothetical protein [Crocinitomicaceae bacterium]
MKYILCLTSLALCFFAFSQIPTNFVTTSDITSSGWEMYAENQEVKVELKRSDCYLNSGLDKQYFLIRITNKTQNNVSVSWEMDLFYNNDCKTCGIGEYEWQIDLGPSGSAEGLCANGSDNEMRMFSKFIDANYSSNDELTGFQFSNLTVQTN